MKHGSIKVIEVKPLQGYSIEVVFEGGFTKVIDLEPLLHGSLFGPLRKPELFRKVRVNPEVAVVEWPNGADFDPETLYNWENYKDELTHRARKWQKSETTQ